MKKKGLALLLSLVMIVQMAPMGTLASAADGANMELVCTTEAHAHEDACKETVLTCTLEETTEGETPHTHGGTCYAIKHLCGKKETEGHAHGESCKQSDLTCTLEETTEGENPHTHEAGCHTETIICGLEEVEPHTHKKDCFSYVCGKTEHQHSDGCYAAVIPANEENTGESSAPTTEESGETGAADEGNTDPTGTTETTAPEGTTESTEETTAPEETTTPTTEPGATVCETCQKDPCECPAPCTECGEAEGHLESCSQYVIPAAEVAEDPQVGDVIWIKPGEVVYKSTTDTTGYTLSWQSYEVKIKEIVLDENGAAAWYKIEYVNLGLGEVFLQLQGYFYVKVASTSVENPEETEPDKGPVSEQLAECESLEDMVTTLQTVELDKEEFTENDVNLVESRMFELIRALDNPTEEEIDNYYLMLNRMLEVRESLGMCTCGSSTGDHGYNCAMYVDFGMRSRSIAMYANEEPAGEPGVVTNKWAEDLGNGTYKLTMEAYATGTTTTTKYIKPADMVIVVDQSASMMYADKPNLEYGIPVSGTKGYKRADLESNTDAQHLASHGLYYMAVGDMTLCFLVYKNNQWYYFDTYLSKSGTEHPSWPSSWGTKPNANWDSCMEQACKSWSHINNNLNAMNADLWERFSRNGIYATRYGSIYWALDDFLYKVAESNADHRISIVGFAGRSESETEILCSLNYVNTQAGFNQIQTAIGNILCTGVSTHHDAGIQKANDVFDGTPIDLTKRDRNLIFFSDGEGSGGTDHNMTLNQSYIAKNTHGANVYSIGTAYAPKNLMEWLSSNYPDAQSTSSLGEQKSDQYFFHAANASDLGNIFGQLSSTVGSTTVTLTESSYIKDVVTEYFTIPDGVDSVTAYAVKCTGYSGGVPQWDNIRESVAPENIRVEGNTVYVTGFNYAGNFVSEGGRKEGTTNEEGDFHGRKLVIEIVIEPNEDFVGGNEVVTNAPGSGLYDDNDETADEFPIPDVDVTLPKIELVIPDLYSRLGSDFLENLTLDKIQRAVTLWRGEHPIALDLTKANFGLEPWQVKYANIKLVIVDAQGNEMKDGLKDIREDTQYSIKITITPKTEGTVAEKSESGNANIYVFYPEMTFQDKTYWYGENIPASDDLQNAKVELKWRLKNPQNGQTIYTDAPIFSTGMAQLYGNEPTVTYTCTPAATGTMPKTDVAVDVRYDEIGYIAQQGDLHYGWFKWVACMPDCGLHVEEHACDAANTPEFYLHANNCRLTIIKTGGEAGEPYVFNIYRNGEYYTQATIVGNDSITICELPVGTYTVQEDTSWSWRYEPAFSPSSETLNRDDADGTITCTNTKKNDHWLNGFSDVIANIFGKKKD